MTGLDTNVVLAWLLRGQARALPGDGPFRISFVALAELVWVLARQLKRPKDEIVAALRMIAQTGAFRFSDHGVFAAAIEDYAALNADFADFLIMRENEAAQCAATLTLDRKALRYPGFRHPSE